jgi:hypothetical protein
MKPGLLTLFLVVAAGVTAGPLPHAYAQNYTQHMALLDAYPLDHPIWISRMGERDAKVFKFLNFVLRVNEGIGCG